MPKLAVRQSIQRKLAEAHFRLTDSSHPWPHQKSQSLGSPCSVCLQLVAARISIPGWEVWLLPLGLLSGSAEPGPQGAVISGFLALSCIHPCTLVRWYLYLAVSFPRVMVWPLPHSCCSHQVFCMAFRAQMHVTASGDGVSPACEQAGAQMPLLMAINENQEACLPEDLDSC